MLTLQYPWCATPSENPFWFTKVTFGLSQKYSKNAIQQALQGLNGVRYIADDTIVWGKTRVPRDKNLEALLNRLVIKKLSLNLEKFKFNQPSLWFYGYTQSKYGRLSGDPKQVEAIKNFKTPTGVIQLRSFLHLANYYWRFIKDFSTLIAPLRELTVKSCKWSWSTIHEKAFAKIKNTIASVFTIHINQYNWQMQVLLDLVRCYPKRKRMVKIAAYSLC
jgi:hypothetical protein